MAKALTCRTAPLGSCDVLRWGCFALPAEPAAAARKLAFSASTAARDLRCLQWGRACAEKSALTTGERAGTIIIRKDERALFLVDRRRARRCATRSVSDARASAGPAS